MTNRVPPSADVLKLALVAWKHNFFIYFSKNNDVSALTQALLRQIEAQRNGEDVDQTLMKAIVKSYGKPRFAYNHTTTS